MSAGTRDHRSACLTPTPRGMNERGQQLLEAHIRSLDPAELTARERLEAALGEPLARMLVSALQPRH